MKPLNKTRVIVIVSLVIFAISLTRSAFICKDFRGTHEFTSIMAIMLGSIAILGGAFFEWMVWLANPLYFISIILFLKGNIKSKKLSVFAAVLSLSFALWTNILASDSGKEAQIASKNSGYVLWMLSIVILTIGINYSMKRAPRP